MVVLDQLYLSDGEVQTNIDDDSNKEEVEGTHYQERFLQQPHALERVVNLKRTLPYYHNETSLTN